jgi:hypothetical protein
MPASDPPPAAPGSGPIPSSSTADEPGVAASGRGSVPPGAPASAPPPPPEAPGLGEQIGATRESVKRLVGAHIELARSEFEDIADAAKRAAVLVGIAVAAGLVAGLIVTVGLPLFLGEAIFGSIGWGILLGVLFLAALGVSASVAALRPGVRASIGRPFALGILVALVVGIVLGLNLTNRGWTALADALVPTMDAASRPLLVAVGGLAVLGALVGLIGGATAAGGGAAVGGLIGGLIVGVFLGFLTALAPGVRVGAAIGVTFGLITWTAAVGVGVARGGFDTAALTTRFKPQRTIDATKETIEWARERMPLSRKS